MLYNLLKIWSGHKGIYFLVQVQGNIAKVINTNTQPAPFKRLTDYTHQHNEINGITYVSGFPRKDFKTQSYHDFFPSSALLAREPGLSLKYTNVFQCGKTEDCCSQSNSVLLQIIFVASQVPAQLLVEWVKS